MADETEQEHSETYGIALGCAAIILILGAYITYSFMRPVQPLRDRQNALLHNLKAIAENINAYRNDHGALPQSLDAVRVPAGPYTDGYRLIVGPKGESFLVVADHVSLDDTGSRCHFACDEKLQIQKLLVSPDAKGEERRVGDKNAPPKRLP